MVTMLECIERVPQILEHIMDIREQNFASLFEEFGASLCGLEQIIFVGSGTSYTSALTSKIFVEKVTGLQTSAVLPNDFLYNTYAYPEKALYVFTSQTGSSSVVRKAQRMIRERGHSTLSITESAGTPIAQESAIHIDMGCGKEEYPMRTIGYCASVFTHMLLALEIGKRTGAIDGDTYAQHIADAKSLPDSHRQITPRAMAWMEKVKRQMFRSRCLVFTGANALQGVALEGSVKVWETPQIISMGYELEEGLHGPNYGYTQNHCVIVLNDGGRENAKALGLARWMKDVHHNGLIIGAGAIDDNDMGIDIKSGDFACLELAPVVQIIAYKLALDLGRDLFAPHDNSVMESYFMTHDLPM